MGVIHVDVHTVTALITARFALHCSFFNFASSDDATYPVEYCERDDTTPVEIEKWSVTGNGDDVDLDAQYDFKEGK